jgi:hypothetical protein
VAACGEDEGCWECWACASSALLLASSSMWRLMHSKPSENERFLRQYLCFSTSKARKRVEHVAAGALEAWERTPVFPASALVLLYQ